MFIFNMKNKVENQFFLVFGCNIKGKLKKKHPLSFELLLIVRFLKIVLLNMFLMFCIH